MFREEFAFFSPCAALRPYVRYYWLYASRRPAEALTFPTGAPQLLFHRRAPFSIPELNASQAPLTVSGQVNFPAHLCTSGDAEAVAVVFRPHAAGAFLHIPLSLLYNCEIAGCDLENRSLNELAERIFACGEPTQCVRLVERWLLAQLAADTRRRPEEFDRIGAAVGTLLAEPRTPVSELADGACLCKKQFERRFRALVGMNPREYAGIVRFQRAMRCMELLRQQPAPGRAVNWAQIACACGYADQTHLIRACRRFGGLTPTALLRCGDSRSDLFSDPRAGRFSDPRPDGFPASRSDGFIDPHADLFSDPL